MNRLYINDVTLARGYLIAVWDSSSRGDSYDSSPRIHIADPFLSPSSLPSFPHLDASNDTRDSYGPRGEPVTLLSSILFDYSVMGEKKASDAETREGERKRTDETKGRHEVSRRYKWWGDLISIRRRIVRSSWGRKKREGGTERGPCRYNERAPVLMNLLSLRADPRIGFGPVSERALASKAFVCRN